MVKESHQQTLSSRERSLMAIDHHEADRVPIFFREIHALEHLWKSEEERVEILLEMGVDEKVSIGIRPRIHPEVTVRNWFEEDRNTVQQQAYSEYKTPAGVLRFVMQCTEDCLYENGIPLESDLNISRGREFLVKGREDLRSFRFLLQEPGKDDIEAFRAEARRKKRFAGEKGILVEGDAGPGGDLALYVCGSDMYYLFHDDPAFAEELIELIYSVDLKCMEIVLEEGVDVATARGCYETAPLWSPELYDKLFAPWVKKKAALTQQTGARFAYFSTGNFIPHMHTLLSAGVDIINAIRPFQGGINDMRVLKEQIGHRICLWGGVNPEEDIERNTLEGIERMVKEVIHTAAPEGGFVLSTGGSLFDKGCYDKVLAFIKAARELGSYPITNLI